MAEGTSKKGNGTVIALSIIAGLGVIGSVVLGYEYYSIHKEVKQLHDNINAMPAGATIPVGVIPPELYARMNKMKAA